MVKKELLSRQVFDKNKFDNTIDSSFKELINSPNPSTFDINLATVEDLFILYSKFFYDIPREDVINSHKFLIEESSRYINYEKNNEEIQALLDEIALLREELLNKEIELLNEKIKDDNFKMNRKI